MKHKKFVSILKTIWSRKIKNNMKLMLKCSYQI